MLVLRVENEEGKGPYYAGNLIGKIEAELGLEFTDLGGCHPIPEEDSELRRNLGELKLKRLYGGFNFGFLDARQFRRWFYNDDILEALKKNGFSLSIYSSLDTREGNTQCVFKKGEKLAILDLLAPVASIEANVTSLAKKA